MTPIQNFAEASRALVAEFMNELERDMPEDFACVRDHLLAGAMIQIRDTAAVSGVREIEVFLLLANGEAVRIAHVADQGLNS